jgi:ABC-2 type transport system permease protein
MRRWLKIMRAEILRDIRTTLRYPVELGTGIFVLYILFMGLYTGARALMGQAATAISTNLTAVVVDYTMWVFAMIAINTVSTDIESEARQGTLEQVYIHAPSYLGLTWVRAMTHTALGSGMVLVLSLMIQLSTGHWLELAPQLMGPLLLIILLTLLGLCGFGLILGAMSLVFKRIGQLSALVQFSLFIVALTDITKLQEPVRTLASHMPLAMGVHLLRQLMAEGSFASVAPGCLSLAVDSVVYVILGSLVFLLLERVARKGGMLSHY